MIQQQTKTAYFSGPVTVETTKGVSLARLTICADDVETEVVLSRGDIDDLRLALRLAGEDLDRG